MNLNLLTILTIVTWVWVVGFCVRGIMLHSRLLHAYRKHATVYAAHHARWARVSIMFYVVGIVSMSVVVYARCT